MEEIELLLILKFALLLPFIGSLWLVPVSLVGLIVVLYGLRREDF